MNTTKTPHFPPQKCGVLGCTGSVGQRFILLLSLHPHFELQAVGASDRSAGKKYRDVVQWKQATALPKAYGEMVVKSCGNPEDFRECDIVFSGLDSDVASEIGAQSGDSDRKQGRCADIWTEMKFLMADIAVFSNAKIYRQRKYCNMS